jgi:hypothetical protein
MIKIENVLSKVFCRWDSSGEEDPGCDIVNLCWPVYLFNLHVSEVRVTSTWLWRSGDQIRDMIRKDLTEAEALFLEKILQEEASDLFHKLKNPIEVRRIVRQEEVTSYGTVKGWLTRNDFLKKLDALTQH